MNKNSFFAFFVISSLPFFGDAQPAVMANNNFSPETYKHSVLKEVEAHRNSDGRVFFTGKIDLPQGKELSIMLFNMTDDAHFLANTDPFKVKKDGTFKTGLLLCTGSDPKAVMPAGQYKIELVCFGPWGYSLGPETSKLPKYLKNADDDLVPTDPEFPNDKKNFEVHRIITLSDLSGEEDAIGAVQLAKLFVKGKGQSTVSVGRGIEIMGLHVMNWTVVPADNGNQTVTLTYYFESDSDKTQVTARWSYNSETKAVSYLDPNSKLISYGTEE